VALISSWSLRIRDGDLWRLRPRRARDAQFALEQALACGMKGSRPIYFAVDQDTTPDPLETLPYFEGVNSVLGVAAHRKPTEVTRLSMRCSMQEDRLGLADLRMVEWRWDARAQLQQYQDGEVYDLDRAVAEDFGQWQAGVLQGTSHARHIRGLDA